MSLYCTLADVREELHAENTTDDKNVMRLIRQFSRRIDQMFRIQNLFVPVITARPIDLVGSNINSGSRTLTLTPYGSGIVPLLSLNSASVNNQALTIGTNVQTYPATLGPWYALQLMGDTWSSWYSSYCSDVWGSRNATITGIWGYNVDYAHAWLDVDTLDGAINDSVTTLVVTDVAGDNPLGESPRISAGNVLQIDTEWMDVIATDVDTNSVTVVRGVNGSSAAAHDDEAVVAVYQVEECIRRAVTRQAAFMYARQGAYNDTTIDGSVGVATRFPKDILQEVYGLLDEFANLG